MPSISLKPGTNKLVPNTVYSIDNLQAYNQIILGANLLGAEDPSQPPAIIIAPSGPDGYGFKAVHEGFSMSGMEVQGGGVFIEGPGGVNRGGRINNNVFNTKITRGEKRGCLHFSCKPQDWDVTNNLFVGYEGKPFAIYGDSGYFDLYIANNELIDVHAGFHIDALGTTPNGMLVVEQNYCKGLKGMNFEFQSTAEDLIFRDNFVEKPNLSAVFNENNGSMAFSLILDKSKKIRIYRNTVLNLERPDGKGLRNGFEVGGDDCIVEDNLVIGTNNVLAVNDGVGTCSVIVRNNQFSQFLESIRNSFPNTSRTLIEQNNGEKTALTWDTNRGRPRRNMRYGSGNPPLPPVILPGSPPEPVRLFVPFGIPYVVEQEVKKP